MDARHAAAARALSRFSRHLERSLSELELSVAQYRVLDLLAGGSAGGRGLADWLAVRPSGVTALVDSLVARGLVERNPDPDDRRRVAHALTDKGRQVQEEATAWLAGNVAEMAEFFGDDAQTAVTWLARWDDALDNWFGQRRRPPGDERVP